MGISAIPEVNSFQSGEKYWSHEFVTFKINVIIPECNPIADVINFGYVAPYLIVFPEQDYSPEESLNFAKNTGLLSIAAEYCSSVVFVYPTEKGGWENAPFSLFPDLIAESRIHQYYRDGMITFRDRFTGKPGDCFIRGAIFRTFIYAYGKSADFVASNYLKKVEGQFLWGPGEITPATLVLNRLSVIPSFERDDIPVVSIGNSDEINDVIKKSCKYSLIKDVADYTADFNSFIYEKKRWCGHLEIEEVPEAMGMVCKPAYEVLKTSADNVGDDRDSEYHKVGYVAYYNKDLFAGGPVPVLLAFHGGGDSSFYISCVSGWWKVAHKHNFLLIAIENHLNSTATEMIELLDKLKEKYPIDEKRIYASGFSMGGCKSWDCYQEFPEVFAALAPMDATYEVGLNVFGKPSIYEINRSVPVPFFYAGGEITPLPELPFQAAKCYDRQKYVFEVNRIKRKYDVLFEDRENWPNKIWGLSGDRTEKYYDESRNAYLTVEYFDSEDGRCITAFGSISGQGHECRQHTCEQAWLFMSQFTR